MIATSRAAFAAFLIVTAIVVPSAAPSSDVIKVREWRARNERKIVAELMQLVSLPSMASNKADIIKNADALTAMFEKRGFAVKRIATPGSPVLVADRIASPARGALTFYMHYDGQPTEAKDWTIGQPFTPSAFKAGAKFDVLAGTGPVDVDARIYGRAVADDKGPIIAFLAAIDGLLDAKVALPWTLRVVLDGEEEAGSPNFEAAMIANAATVRADLAVIVDSPRHPSNLPTVFYGSRGVAGVEITVYGATGDLHSGNYGNCIILNHGFGIQTRYGHLSGYAISTGTKVKRGQVIGYVGQTGRATSPHVHYEILLNGQPVSPVPYLTFTR